MSEALPWLHVHVTARGIDERMSMLLDRTLALGRDAECDVALPSATVSRRHLSLFLRDGRLMARDHSSNGTRVDGEPLHLAVRELAERAALEVGPYSVAVQLADAPAPERAATIAPACVVPVAAPLMLSDRGADLGWSASIAAAAPRWGERAKALARMQAGTPPEPRASARALELAAVLSEEPASSELPDLVVARQPEAIELPAAAPEPESNDQLEQLLRDPSVSAIMMVDAATLFVDRAGKRERCPSQFRDERAVLAALERLVAPLGIDPSDRGCFSAELDDGTRLHAIMPPLSVRGPCLTLRKLPSERRTLSEWTERGQLSRAHAQLLARAVRERAPIVVCGEPGSGTTSLLDCLASAIPEHERVVTIESSAELTMVQPHVISLVADPSDPGAQRELLAQCTSLRADRVLLGECGEREAYGWLLTLTRMRGCMTVLCADSPSLALQRLEAWCQLEASELPLAALRQRLAATRALFVQLVREDDGARRVASVVELSGLNAQGELLLCEPKSADDEGSP